jgi:hypothetical protein
MPRWFFPAPSRDNRITKLILRKYTEAMRRFGRGIGCEADYAAGTGSAVTDLIFSIAKREVTFFNGTALISFL